jgi:intergrase/recombinase
MATKLIETTVNDRVIDWVNPESDVEVTLEDYRNMIRQAESGKDLSFSEYTQKVNQWLKNNL